MTRDQGNSESSFAEHGTVAAVRWLAFPDDSMSAISVCYPQQADDRMSGRAVCNAQARCHSVTKAFVSLKN
ncbi:MAG: hypothetical protein A2W93_05650 [Bacteroidetes bacterium GWF2_43_63]|nr:MAG: hypothetical protein A2W93_05650 [Bacteroidetes bacterium GWF2_43_63]HBG69977.1 hypothetical protein [Bacteroidales bacterium]